MAGLRHRTNFEKVLTVVNAWKTLAATKAPTNQALQALGLELSSDGVTGTGKGIELRLTRITAASGTGTAFTPKKIDNRLSTTVQATARVNFTAEPSEDGTAEYLQTLMWHPQGGVIREFTFLGIYIKEGTEVAVQAKVATGETAVNVSGAFICEE